jgi:hypothetical protein
LWHRLGIAYLNIKQLISLVSDTYEQAFKTGKSSLIGFSPAANFNKSSQIEDISFSFLLITAKISLSGVGVFIDLRMEQ